MIERQRVILAFIERTNGASKRTQLMKWLFLLRQEVPEAISPSFYEFVPYRYGPFSFQAYKEISALEAQGFVESGNLAIPTDIRRQAREQVLKLRKRVIQGIETILRKYGKLSLPKLIDSVYTRYPWYASRSELRQNKNGEDKSAPLAVYTIGYEGRTVDGVLDHLLHSGIERLIDVRKNATSRKYGLSGKTFASLCSDVGIDYVHIPDLGIPSSMRVDLTTDEAYKKLFDQYERDILPSATDSISEVADLCLERPSALMCFEASSKKCHRGRLAPRVAEQSSLEVHHL